MKENKNNLEKQLFHITMITIFATMSYCLFILYHLH